MILGRRADTSWIADKVAETFIVKDRGCLGPRDTDLHEVSILRRVITYLPLGSPGGEQVEFQAGPCHAELIVKQCNLDGEKRKGV